MDVPLPAPPVTAPAGDEALVASHPDELATARRQALWNADMLARTESLCRSGSFELLLPQGQLRPSSGLLALLGRPPQDAPIERLDALDWVPPDEQGYVAGIWQHAVPGEPFEFQHRIRDARGRTMIVLHRGRIEPGPDGRLRGVALLQDITAQREAELRAQDLATHDEVTGLPNRAAFLDQLDAAMHAARWTGQGLSLIVLDVPRVAEVRSKMGFGAGDTLAMALAARLQQALRPGERCARLSDTEFAVFREEAPEGDDLDARSRANRLRDELQRVVRLGGTDVFPLCVAGLAGFPADGQSPARLLECAQTARLHVGPGEDAGVFRPDSNRLALRELQVESALREALSRGELRLHYQPQVSLDSGRIVGAEALLRWESPTLGAVSPGEFIPVAERCGLIGRVGDWVLRRACEQIARWQEQSLPALRVGINLSAAQLQQPDLPLRLQRLMSETGVEPARLGIELTESAAMADVAQASRLLGEIRALGVEISLDDFGTGHSSLSCLRSLPIDVVKIDRAFVHDPTDAPEDVAFSRALISMAHGLHKRVLAEGVETEGQLALLAADRCDRIQGHVFGRAMPAAEFEALVREDRRIADRFLAHRPRRRTLLLVDDEANILAALKRLLRPDGYHVLTAASAQEGLARLAEHEVDVIVSDQRMPGMTGVEFLRRANQLYPDTLRLVLSGFTELQSIIDAVNEGAIYKFLTKPWDDARLREHVAEAFRQKELADENRRLQREIETANADFQALNQRLVRAVERQHAQAELVADSARSLRDALEVLPVPVIGIDDDGLLAFANDETQARWPQAGAAIGLPAADALAGTPWLAALGRAADAAIDLPPSPGRAAARLLSRPIAIGSGGRGRVLVLLESWPRARGEPPR